MKILLTGASGQVGQALSGALQPLGDVIALGRAHLDLNDFAMIRQVIRAERPQLIVNCAGYTAVDRAESEPALAHRINGLAPGVIAEEAKRLAAPLIHFSTDYVFDGCKPDPYLESDPPNPINVYGESKLAGEHAIAASGAAHIILRCSWIYGMHGNNFLRTILNLAKTRDELRVVSDQYGAPTWVGTIAAMTRSIVAHPGAQDAGWWRDQGGIYHLCSEGRTSWHGFAQAIVARAGLPCKVLAISSEDYGAAARRPANSSMSPLRLTSRFGPTPHWEEALSQCLQNGASASSSSAY